MPFKLAWFLAPALTVMACHIVFNALSVLCPRLLGSVTGGRIAKGAGPGRAGSAAHAGGAATK